MKVLIIISLLCVSALAEQKILWDAEGRKTEADQTYLWRSNLQKSGDMTPGEKIAFLSLGLRNMGNRKDMSDHSPDVDEVYEKIRDELVAIPGHAEYYRDRINAAQVARKAAIGKTIKGTAAEYGIADGDFRNEETRGLQTLRYLPSPETVKVLGEYLADEWRSPIPVQDGWTWPSLARHSVEMLAVMPIVQKPTALTEDPGNPGMPIPDLKAWQFWYEQIKSGNRTFRFEGDPTEYDLNGPASKRTLERISLRRRMKSGRATRRAEGDASSPIRDHLPIYGSVIAGLAVLASLVWHFRKNKNRDDARSGGG